MTNPNAPRITDTSDPRVMTHTLRMVEATMIGDPAKLQAAIIDARNEGHLYPLLLSLAALAGDLLRGDPDGLTRIHEWMTATEIELAGLGVSDSDVGPTD